MRISHVEHHSAEELITRLRNVRLLKKPEIKIYENCTITLEKISTRYLYPTQRYVLIQELEKVRDLRWALQDMGYDIFNLNGYLDLWLNGENEPITLLPPVVEESIEQDGSVIILVNDGMHRLYLAHRQWVIPQVVFVRGIPKTYPYYAYPNPFQWEGIEIIDELPEGYIKKWHRISDYHTLYRDFNSAFSRVGAPRGRFTKN